MQVVVNSCQAYPHTEHPQRHGTPQCPLPNSVNEQRARLIHLPDELVDVGLPVTKVTALDEVLEFTCPPTTSGVGELERPKEVGCLPYNEMRKGQYQQSMY